MGELVERFPLFPLGLVLLPGEVVPLHIFEERYKLMIGECLERQTEFGIVWLSDEELKDTGCAARVTQLLERMDDGRMNILVEGTTPFLLQRRIDDMPYPAGDVELLEELDDGDSEAAGRDARARYADLVEHVTESRPSEVDLAELNTYGMAATIDFDREAKQGLQELRSERRRLERLAELFEGAMERLERAEQTAERARGNGKVRFEG